MSKITKIQLFILALILGFLTGPHVISALQDTETKSFSLHETALIEKEEFPLLSATNTYPATIKLGHPANDDPYRDLSLEAKSVYVWDIRTHRKLYSINEEQQLPLASITKIMMALKAKEVLSDNTHVTITADDLKEEGDNGLLLHETWALDDLLDFTLVASSNDGASAIARTAGEYLGDESSSSSTHSESKQKFIEKMNEKARMIGLDQTYFINESGLDVSETKNGAYGSARDMAILFEYIFKKHPGLLTSTARATLDVSSKNTDHRVVNTNIGVEKITGIIGSKTGYTDIAGGNLVVIVDVGMNNPVVIAVLGSTQEGRFTDVDKLIDATVKK